MLLNAQYQTLGKRKNWKKKPLMFIVSLDIYKSTSGEENYISSYFWHMNWDNLLE